MSIYHGLKMDGAAKEQVLDKLRQEIAQVTRSPVRIAIVGNTPTAVEFVAEIESWGSSVELTGIYDADSSGRGGFRKSIATLEKDAPDLVVIASDADKESLLAVAAPFLQPPTKIVIGGFRHFEFRDALFAKETAAALLPSFANGYPNTLIHIFQCLRSAARLNLTGVVAEFGMFKGGTTMLISRFIEGLCQSWPVYAFDTFTGFPAARSVLDMYSHADCVFLDVDALRQCFAGRDVSIIEGDVVDKASILADKEIVLAFIDTDNFSSAAAILSVITDRVQVGGAIVFDHFTGRDRFLYTLGERIAAKRLLEDERFFNLHDTGVFVRLK